jgi:hypothetical protein
MKQIKVLILIFISILITACDRKKDLSITNNDSKKISENDIINAKSKVKTSGDEISYADLELFYLNNKSQKEEILPYSILMVEKHHKFKYCSKVFENFLDLYSEKELKYDGSRVSLIIYLNNFKKLNSHQKASLLYYLEIGAENKNLTSVRYLEILYREGIGVMKNAKTADSLKLEIEHLETERHVR